MPTSSQTSWDSSHRGEWSITLTPAEDCSVLLVSDAYESLRIDVVCDGVCAGTCCSIRSPFPASSWLLRCVTSNRLTHSLEVHLNLFLTWSGWSFGLWNINRTCVLSGKRPFGVSLLYMGWDKHYGFQLYQSDPSGNYGGWKATCIGNNSAVSETHIQILMLETEEMNASLSCLNLWHWICATSARKYNSFWTLFIWTKSVHMNHLV